MDLWVLIVGLVMLAVALPVDRAQDVGVALDPPGLGPGDHDAPRDPPGDAQLHVPEAHPPADEGVLPRPVEHDVGAEPSPVPAAERRRVLIERRRRDPVAAIAGVIAASRVRFATRR